MEMRAAPERLQRSARLFDLSSQALDLFLLGSEAGPNLALPGFVANLSTDHDFDLLLLE